MVNRAKRGSILSSGSDAFFTLNDDGLAVDWLSDGESGKETDGNKYVTPYMSRTDDRDDSWFSEVESNSMTDNDDSPESAKGSARRTERKHSDEELRDMFARTAGFFSELESDAETFSKPKSGKQSEKRSSRRSPKKKEKTCLQFDTNQAMRVPQGMNDVESDALLSEFETDNTESIHRSRREKPKKKSSKDSTRERRRTHRDRASHQVYDSEVETDRESPSRRRRRPQPSSSKKYDIKVESRSMDRSRSNRESMDRSRSNRTKQRDSSRSPKQSLSSRSSHRKNDDREHSIRKSRHSSRPSGYGSDHPQSDHEVIAQRKSRRSSLLGADPAEESNSDLDFSKHSHARSPRHSIHDLPAANRHTTSKHDEDIRGRRVSPGRESRSPIKSPRRLSTKKSMDPLKGSRHGPLDGSKGRPERNKHRRATMTHLAPNLAPNLIVENVKKKYGRTGSLDYPTDTEDDTNRMDDSIRSRRQRAVGAWKEKEQFKGQVDDFSDAESQSCTEEDQHRQDILNLSRKGPIRASSRQRERSGGAVKAKTLLGGGDIDSESDLERTSSSRMRRSSLDNGYGKDSIYGSIDQIIDNRRNRRLNSERDETPRRRTSMDPSMKSLQATIESSPQKSSRNLACDNATQTSGKSQNSNNSSEKNRKESKVSTATCKDGQSYDKSVDELLKARRLRGVSQRAKEQKKEAKKFNPMEMLAGANVFSK